MLSQQRLGYDMLQYIVTPVYHMYIEQWAALVGRFIKLEKARLACFASGVLHATIWMHPKLDSTSLCMPDCYKSCWCTSSLFCNVSMFGAVTCYLGLLETNLLVSDVPS